MEDSSLVDKINPNMRHCIVENAKVTNSSTKQKIGTLIYGKSPSQPHH